MNKALKIAHVVPFTGRGSCGMYGTAYDLMMAEMVKGHIPFVYDPRPSKQEYLDKIKDSLKNNPELAGENQIKSNTRVEIGHEEAGVCSVDYNFVKDEIDFIVSHSGLDSKLSGEGYNTPYIHIAHGRPYSSFLLEQTDQIPIYSLYRHLDQNENLKRVITLWEPYKDYLELLFKETPIEVFNAPVDLSFWKPIDTDFDFSGEKGEINIVCADIWRLDKDPYYIFHGFREFAKRYPEAKLHVYGCRLESGWNCFMDALKYEGHTGELAGLVPPDYLLNVFNAADIVITPHKIATRTVREPLACGTQLVAGNGNPYTKYTADVEDVHKYADAIEEAYLDLKKDKEACHKQNIEVAKTNFDSNILATQMLDLIESVCNE